MIAESQEFNDNVGNDETDLCFYCKLFKTIDEFTSVDGGHVCNQCHEDFKRLCDDKGIQFIERQRGKPRWSGWHGGVIDYTDTYAVKDGNETFIKGLYPKNDSIARAKVFRLKMQYLGTGGQFITFHSCNWAEGRLDSPSSRTPIEFVKWVLSKGWLFQNASLSDHEPFGTPTVEFHGNLKEYSCAFHFRIFDPAYADEVRKVFVQAGKMGELTSSM